MDKITRIAAKSGSLDDKSGKQLTDLAARSYTPESGVPGIINDMVFQGRDMGEICGYISSIKVESESQHNDKIAMLKIVATVNTATMTEEEIASMPWAGGVVGEPETPETPETPENEESDETQGETQGETDIQDESGKTQDEINEETDEESDLEVDTEVDPAADATDTDVPGLIIDFTVNSVDRLKTKTKAWLTDVLGVSPEAAQEFVDSDLSEVLAATEEQLESAPFEYTIIK